MRAKTRLKPGQDGATSLLDRCGGRSHRARCRDGEAGGLRHKTIEPIFGTFYDNETCPTQFCLLP
jgi:hypothetical protein